MLAQTDLSGGDPLSDQLNGVLGIDIHTGELVALMDKSMEIAEIATDGIQQMMEASVTPHLGQTIDISL